MTADVDIARMSAQEKIAEAMRRSLALLPAAARGTVESLLRPESLGLVAGTLVLWAGSHFFGVGQIVDVLLLVVGVAALGLAAVEGAEAFYLFATEALQARNSAGLDRAARHFSRAVTLLGMSTVQAVLLRGSGQALRARGSPKVFPRPALHAAPPAGNQLRLSRPATLSGGHAGRTDPYGVITISRNQTLTEQRVTLFHELVHRYFSPRTGPLRELRAEISMVAYSRSALLRYLEEALAEGYAQLRVRGLAEALKAYRFPLHGGYVTISKLSAEGHAIGTITLGGQLFCVSVSQGPIPSEP